MTDLPHDSLVGGPEHNWELGTRDTGAYATISEVVDYLEWLGSNVTESVDKRTDLSLRCSYPRTRKEAD